MHKKKITLWMSAFFCFITACTLLSVPVVATPDPTATIDPQLLIDQAVSATVAAQTQVAGALQQTFAADTQVALAIQQTMTQLAIFNQQTLAAMATATPTQTPLPTFTFTPSIPTVSVSSETNCRSGPGLAFELFGVLHPGETTEVLGLTTSANYILVRNPDSPTQICWLWGQYATVIGNTSGLPVATPPPTPTPPAGFTLTYLGLVTCAPSFALRFEIRGQGSTTWQSIKIEMTDSTTSVTRVHTADAFLDRTLCPVVNTLQDLEGGEVGNVTAAIPGHFDYNPTGHSITVKVTLYAQNGLAGESTFRTITVTP